MEPEQKSGMSATHVILIILGAVGLGFVICAGIIVVCLVAITALGTSANKTFGSVATRVGGGEFQAEQPARQFIVELCAGLTQAAWDHTSAAFQARHIKIAGPNQSKYFADFLQEHPGLRNPATIEIQSQHIDPSQPTLQATITPKSGGKIVLHLKLINEVGIWKVDDVSVIEGDKEKGGAKEKES